MQRMLEDKGQRVTELEETLTGTSLLVGAVYIRDISQSVYIHTSEYIVTLSHTVSYIL